ncbi:MAG: apolipoprotein N-acyltransferase [Magnetococcales bacterium]|nr:apolipoprotein N-acyltransferase [Magnetococcales bacterium]
MRERSHHQPLFRDPYPLGRLKGKGIRLVLILAALLCGAVVVRGFEPWNEPWSMVLGFGVWMRMVIASPPRRAVLLGFFFGLSHFALGFSWLLTSLIDHGGLYPLAGYGVLLVLAAVMSLYPMLYAWLLSRLIANRYWTLVIAGPLLWVGLEWVRAHFATGFPWNLVGYAWSWWLPVLQVADLGGVYLLSWLTVFLAALSTRFMFWGGKIWPLVIALSLGAVVFLSAYQYGEWRLDQNPVVEEGAEGITVGMVQGNISQAMKFDPQYRYEQVDLYLRLTESTPNFDLMIWPETALPYFVQRDRLAMNRIGSVAALRQTAILTGAPTFTKRPSIDDERPEVDYYNSAMLFLPESGGVLEYHKHHLVPFGEFLPFRGWIPDNWSKMTHGTKDFTRGPGPSVLDWEKGPLGPLVCYEVIFPDEVREVVAQGAKWLVNITNDGWFGATAKPQHLAMTRMRAVENRVPMIRVANTGISAIYDAMGRQLQRINVDRMAVIGTFVPENLVSPGPFFWIGTAWAWLMGLTSLVVLIFLRWRFRW